jgi:prolyl oligopeptidase PreP (S9A serine peptidase family)
VQHSAGTRTALLRVERHAGHGGADLIAQEIESAADTYAFLCDQLRVRTPKP